MSENPTLQIPRDVIEPIIQAHVSKAVLEALDGHRSLVDGLVSRVVNQGVDHEGRPSDNEWDKKHHGTFVNWTLKRAVERAAKAAIEDAVLKQEALIRKSIAAQLKDSRSPLVKQLIAVLVGALTDDKNIQFGFHVTCEAKKEY